MAITKAVLGKSLLDNSARKRILSSIIKGTCLSTTIKEFSEKAFIRRENADNSEHLWVKSTLPEIKAVEGKAITETIWERTAEWGNATAYECGITDRKISYNELHRSSKGLAASLMKAGIKNKSIIAFVIPNIPEYPIALFGTLEAGCIASPVNPCYTAEEIKRQLQISGATAVITTEYFLNAVITAKLSCPNLKNIIVIGRAPEGCLSFYEMIKADPTGFEFLKGSEINMLEDVAIIPFSSGTTGPPKGVMLTHSNISTNMQQYCQHDVTMFRLLLGGHQDRMIGLLPFFHMYGATILIQCALHGAHMLTLPRFEPALFAGAIKKHKPHTLQMVTPLLNFLIQSPDITKKEFRDVHSIMIGATPIGAGIIKKVLEKAGKYIFFQEAWGMTEVTTFATIVPLSVKNSKSGSCGTSVSSSVVKVVDTTTGRTLGSNERGELLIRGPQLMKGYLNNQKATDETIDSEGWLHTGDIGYYDDDKYFYIVDRLKELIKVKGFQVSPSELEFILRDHEDVADVAVVGVPNEEWGELPRAYIVLKSGKIPNEASINSFLANKVTSYKQLRGGIEYVEAIPKAPSGKILRRELLDEYKKNCGIAS